MSRVPVTDRAARIPKLTRFGWLMGLYAENFTRLTRLFEPADLAPGRYASSIGDGLDLRVDVIEQHAYTTELRLTYALRDPVTGEPDPSAFLRLYRDARQVERSEEHTSELQSLMRISYAVFCLKKKKQLQHTLHQPSLT